MPFKRSLAVASTISALVISGVLVTGAVSAIANDAHKAGEYSPVDLSRSGPNSGQEGARPSSNSDVGTGVSSGPDIGAPSGATLTPGPNSSSSSRSGGSGAKPVVNAPSDTSNRDPVPVNPSPGSGDPTTTSTSFDDHGGDSDGGHGSDDALDDD